MGRDLTLTAADGHELDAYEATADAAKGGVIVLQEIFGVNPHIRAVADRFAAAGYTAVAPALFDRIERGYQSGYSAEEVAAARPLLAAFDWHTALIDVEAARAHLAAKGVKVAVVGFCLGGSLAFLSATRLDGLAAAVGYYGGYIAKVADETPRCPVLLHYGESDHTISMADVEAVRAARPDVDLHVYHAGHGFNCDARDSYDQASADLAWSRTIGLMDRAVG